MRKLVLALIVIAASHGAARADFGIGLFVGEPTGLDLKVDLQPKSALDIVIGVVSINDGGRDVSYGHLTYLYTVTTGRGRTVRIPLRLGIGASVFGVTEDNTQLAARVPFELGIRFRRSPLEIYGEITFVLRLIDDVDTNLDGGVGLRLYF
jgi:hypothetical protein